MDFKVAISRTGKYIKNMPRIWHLKYTKPSKMF